MIRTIFGIQPVREALRVHGDRVSALFVQTGSDNPKLEALRNLAKAKEVAVRPASRSELDRRTKGGMHQGALAEAPELTIRGLSELEARLASISVTAPPVITLLDGVMDPMNFGAVVRSAVALGSGWIVFPEHGAAPLTPATFRASAGAIEHAALFRVPSLVPALQLIHAAGGSTVLLEGSSETDLDALDLTALVGLVVGAEDKGARPAVRKAVTVKARLPMTSAIQSLNASVASAVAHYEVSRQRKYSSNTIK